MSTMKNLTIEKIAEVTGGTIIGDISGIAGKEIAGVEYDSRLILEDYVFIATKGEKVDGHSFISQVFEKGAMFVIGEKQPEDLQGPMVLVEDSFDALRSIATYYRSVMNTRLIGITGSVGKTSTRTFIATVLAEHYNILQTQGNLNNEIGVPLMLLRIRSEHEIAVIEMGINHFGEMSRLTAMAQPNVCVMTNIGTCHLENLIDRNGVLRAKSEIFEGLRDNALVVINGDDDKLQTIKEVQGKAPVRFGVLASEDSNINALNYYGKEIKNLELFGSIVHIQGMDGTSFEAKVPLPGKHMIYNAVAATTIGKYYGLSDEEIIAGLGKCKAVGGRTNVIALDGITLIDDCYNANPNSMKAALDLLRIVSNKKVAILGDMFELGEKEALLHAEIGEYAVTNGIQKLICVGNLSKNMFEAANKYCDPNTENNKIEVLWFESLEEVMSKLPDLLGEDETVLVKASHGMHFENIVTQLTEKYAK